MISKIIITMMTFSIIMIILLVTFAVRVEEGVGPRLRRPHRLQPLGLHHPGDDNMVNMVVNKVVNWVVNKVANKAVIKVVKC